MSSDPIAYTYEADYHCPSCTEARFGRCNGSCNPLGLTSIACIDGQGIPGHPLVAKDREGNTVGAVAPWDEWQQDENCCETMVCGTCGTELDRVHLTIPTPEPGTFVCGHHGQYALGMVYQLAESFGRPFDASELEAFNCYYFPGITKSWEGVKPCEIALQKAILRDEDYGVPGGVLIAKDCNCWEVVHDAIDQCEEWLNDHTDHLPNHRWMWDDGDFGYYNVKEIFE